MKGLQKIGFNTQDIHQTRLFLDKRAQHTTSVPIMGKGDSGAKHASVQIGTLPTTFTAEKAIALPLAHPSSKTPAE